MNHDKLLDKLNSFHASDKSCKKVYCTTCGGLAHAIRSGITPQINEEISTALSNLTISEFLNLEEWCGYLLNNYPISVQTIYERESKILDTSNIQQLDYYLFHARLSMKNTVTYRELLDQGINAAIETANDSLIETVAIILGGEILNQDRFLKLALEKSKTNKNIHRVLYNNIREKITQVRNYVGDGTSTW